MTFKISELYASKKLRGKAKEGFIRPTLRELLTADVLYEEIVSYTPPHIYSGSDSELHKIDPNGNNVWKYTEHSSYIWGVAVG